MKTNILKRLTGLTIVLLALVSLSSAQQTSELKLNGHSLKIKGTSNLHDWSMDAEEVSGNVNAILNGSSITEFKDAKIIVDVEEIESGKRIMNNKTYDALNSDKHPKITFTLKSVKDLYAAGSRLSGKALGELEIAGKSRSVTIPFNGKFNNGGKNITITGDYSIQMTDYDVDPPTAMLGSLTTGNKVTLEYEFTFSK